MKTFEISMENVKYSWRSFFRFLIRMKIRKAFSSIFYYDYPISQNHNGIYFAVFGVDMYWFF